MPWKATSSHLYEVQNFFLLTQAHDQPLFPFNITTCIIQVSHTLRELYLDVCIPFPQHFSNLNSSSFLALFLLLAFISLNLQNEIIA